MFQEVMTWIAENLLSQVPILIALIALIGLLLQRKPFGDVVGGTLRAAIGIVIMTLGINVFVGGLSSFQTIVASAVGLDAPSSTSTLDDFLAGAGSVAPLIIAGGFAIHLLLVAVFKAARYVYLTGHLMLWMSIVIAATFVEVFADVDRLALITVGSLVLACYMTLQPLWIDPLMRRAMGHSKFGLAHTTSTLAVLTGYGAKALKLGDPKKHDTERLNLPKSISFLKDMNVATAVIVGAILLTALGFADPETVASVTDGDPAVVWGVMQALAFAGGIAILLFGVRMFLAEIVPSFKGISDKLLKGSKPALDIPVVFPVAPTAVIVGFITSVLMFLLLMGVFAWTGWFVLVPPMIMLFFGGGAAGVFGNAVAGWRGAVFGGVINGLILAFGQWIFWGLWSDTAPELATLADPDWYFVGGALTGLSELLSPLGTGAIWAVGGIVAVISVAILLALGRRTAHNSDTQDHEATTQTPA
ncbi:PTS transporter subunit IIC [Demequina sediminicola]|uniref:PTS transporter subunit IIC n=1 Tax=Demequina sediminicola TaxID=1095026 RepID=UPI000783809F|nr:PTS transporter subunit IIC [Demequina sediminicola]